jgi:hypothetical protein
MNEYRFYDNEAIKKNDILLIPFGGRVPSVYRVLRANKRKMFLEVIVLADNYEKTSLISGTRLNVGKAIYEGYWCFCVVKDKKPTSPRIIEEKP